MPTVSVIIPAYNCELYIAETISSVLEQTYKDLELIVVDDGSTDSTPSIVSSCGPPVRLVHQANRGVCKARNLGIREANGKFICLLDHDDFWFPEKLERQMQVFQRDTKAGVVYSPFILWHPNTVSGIYPHPESYDRMAYPDDIDNSFSGWIYHQFLLDCWMLTSTAMFRAEVFDKCGVFDESLPYSEDWDLWLRISQQYRFVKLCRPTTLYRQHPQQGNRLVRDIDYRTLLLTRAVKNWGLCSRDGRCLSRLKFNRNIARYHCEFALSHLKINNRSVAINSLAKAWTAYPVGLKYLAYIPAALIGWKPA